MKKQSELVVQLQLPEGKAARLRKGQIVIVSVSPRIKKEFKKVEKKPTTLEFVIHPWGLHYENVMSGGLFIDKDPRLKIDRRVDGKWGKSQTAFIYRIVVPAGFPDKIKIIGKTTARKIDPDVVTILYSPDGTVDQLIPRNQY